MLTKTNKTFIVAGIAILILGFIISFIAFLPGLILCPIGGALLFFGLIVQKKYKGSKL